MAQTKKGESTEILIINAAKQLFYENGYNSTTVSQITNLAGVNNGLFTYYFKTKNALAGQITTAYRLKLRNTISKQMFDKLKSYDFALAIAIEYRKDVELMCKNAKLRRFIIEQRADDKPDLNISYDEILETRRSFVHSKRGHYYQLQRRLINPDISDLDLDVYQLCGINITNTLMQAYAERLIKDATPEYLSDKYIELCFSLLHLSPERIQKLKVDSLAASALINIKVGPYFEIVDY